jgi:hypothetical protein
MSKTATPWKNESGSKTIRSVKENYWLATMDSWDGAVDNEANAEFIVTAVNNHDSLVEALTGLLPTAENWATTCEINGEGPNNPAAVNVRRARLALASLTEGKERSHV